MSPVRSCRRDEVGHVPEAGQDAGGLAGAVVHAGERHLDAAGVPGLGDDAEAIVGVFGRIRRGFAEGAALPAERGSERLVAIPAQHLRAAVAGDAFRLPVEEKDAPLQVVGDDPLFQVVQDMFQIVPVAHQGFKRKLIHVDQSLAFRNFCSMKSAMGPGSSSRKTGTSTAMCASVATATRRGSFRHSSSVPMAARTTSILGLGSRL